MFQEAVAQAIHTVESLHARLEVNDLGLWEIGKYSS
jgi:hypothetical protein